MRTRNIVIMLVVLIILGAVYYITSRPEPPTPEEPTYYAWMISDDEIDHVVIDLAREGKSQSFIKIPEGDKFPWHFDDPELTPVYTERWGGGIPLLLSGPGVARILYEDAPEDKLAEFGLTDPRMTITLTMEDGNVLPIYVGDETPDGQNFYLQAPFSNDVATVDISWYQEMARLVLDPPYVPPPEE